MSIGPHVAAREALALELNALTNEAWANWKSLNPDERETSRTTFLRDVVGQSAHVTYGNVATAAARPDEKRIKSLESLELYCERVLRPWIDGKARLDAFMERVHREYWPVEQLWLDQQAREKKWDGLFEDLTAGRNVDALLSDFDACLDWIRGSILVPAHNNSYEHAIECGFALARGLTTRYLAPVHGSMREFWDLMFEIYMATGFVALEQGEEHCFRRVRKSILDAAVEIHDADASMARNIHILSLAELRAFKLESLETGGKDVDSLLAITLCSAPPGRILSRAEPGASRSKYDALYEIERAKGVLFLDSRGSVAPMGTHFEVSSNSLSKQTLVCCDWERQRDAIESFKIPLPSKGDLLGRVKFADAHVMAARVNLKCRAELGRSLMELDEARQALVGGNVHSLSVWSNWYVAAGDVMKAAGNQYGMVLALTSASRLTSAIGNRKVTIALDAAAHDAKLKPPGRLRETEVSVEGLIAFLEQTPIPLAEDGAASGVMASGIG